MLKKRILASAMASVMALGSVSIVAFAADDIKTEAVSKDQLKKYIESLDKFVDDELDDYGDAQTEKLENAIAFAENVVADRLATADEYTAAYQMVKSIKDNLQKYTGAQLQDLIDDYQADIDTENKLNKNDDLIWSSDSFRDFEDAFYDAEDYVDSKDPADTTNAYIELQDAHKNLEDMETIKKSDFRRALKEYEAILKAANEYQTWRRGKCTVGINKDYRTIKDANGKIDVKDAAYVTYGELYNIIEGASDEMLQKKDGDAFGTVAGVWLPVSATTGKTTVKQFINEAYVEFDNIESASETSDKDIIKGYKVCLEAIKVYNGWEVDDAKRGSKTSIESLIKDYTKDIIGNADDKGVMKDFLGTGTGGLIKVTETAASGGGSATPNIEVKDGKVKVLADLTLKVKGGKLCIDSGKYDSSASGTGVESKAFKADDDITEYIPITGATVNAAAAHLAKALAIYDTYLAVAKDADADTWKTAFGTTATNSGKDSESVIELDDNKSISKPDGGTPEYRLIWRNIKYALDNLFPAGDATYKKRDVEKLVDAAYELAELTGDAETFATNHQALVDWRQDAVEWLAAADVNGYKDSEKYKPDDANNEFAKLNTNTGATATDVKKKLQDAYDDLADQLKDYPMSYAEIAELIATVAEGLDDKDYGSAAADVKAKLQTVAIGLSTLDETKNETDAPFDEDREFLGHNRLNIKGNDAEKQLYKDVQALQTAIEEATKEPEGTLGDINGDGFANALDALEILKGGLTDAQVAVADVNKDGFANSLDALAILKGEV